MYSRAYRGYVTALLLVVYIFNQIDRTVFGIVMEPIKQELGLSDSQLGFLAGPALVLFYATLGIPIARWADRSHRVNIMSGAIALWSGVVMLCAVAGKFWHLALVRVGVGIGEAGFSAIAQSVIADYHSPAERTRALSIFLLAIPLGPALSSLMGGWVNEVYGWRAVFIVAGLPGMVLALLMKWTVREPPRPVTFSVAPVQEAQPPLRFVLRTLWRRAALRHLAIATALLTLVSGGVLGWLATFFIRVHRLSTAEVGTWLALIFAVGGGAGIWLSGTLIRRLRTENERTHTRVLAGCAVLGCLMLIGALLWPEKRGALLLACAAVGVLNFFYAPSFALVQGLCAANARATILAILIFLQMLFAGVIGLQLTGILSDALAPQFDAHSLRWAMIIMTPVALLAAVHFWLAGRSIDEDSRDVAGRNQGAMNV